jgi:hypothetical protein
MEEKLLTLEWFLPLEIYNDFFHKNCKIKPSSTRIVLGWVTSKEVQYIWANGTKNH